MAKFSAGQKVVCIDSSETAGLLEVGKIYEVMGNINHINHSNSSFDSLVNLPEGYYNPIRFTLLENAQVENMKIAIYSELCYTIIIDALYAIGCKWSGTGSPKREIGYLFVRDGEIYYTNNSEFFDEHEFEEYHLTTEGKFEKVRDLFKSTVSEKSPAGLSSRAEVNHQRIGDILNAMIRYHEAKIEIPQEWMDELFDLNLKNNS